MRGRLPGAGLWVLLALIGLVWPGWAASPRPARQSAPPIYLPLVARSYPRANHFGVEMKSITEAQGLEALVAGGVTWTRRVVWWPAIEPQEGQRDWSALASLQSELAAASAQQLRVVLVVMGTPEWAQQYPGLACGPILPEKLPAFADFAAELVQRLKLHPYNVRDWEIWNEPDVAWAAADPANMGYGCWGDPALADFNGGAFASLLQQVYPAVKAADPRARVWLGGLLLDCPPADYPAGSGSACPSGAFLAGVLAAGGGAYFDGVAFHAYDYYLGSAGQYWNAPWRSGVYGYLPGSELAPAFPGPVLASKVDFLRWQLAPYGLADRPLLLTELALLCDVCGDDTPAFERTKASYVVQAYTLAQQLDLPAAIWFNAFGWRNSGLLYADLEPRLALDSYAFTARMLLDQQPDLNTLVDADQNGAPEALVLKFAGPYATRWAAWSLDGLPHALELPAPPVAAFTMLGEPLDPSAGLLAEVEPLWLEFAP